MSYVDVRAKLLWPILVFCACSVAHQQEQGSRLTSGPACVVEQLALAPYGYQSPELWQDDGFIYWADRTDRVDGRYVELAKTDKSSGQTVALASGRYTASRLVGDSQYIYWSKLPVGTEPVETVRVSKTGGAEEQLVSSEDSSISVVAVDDNWLYLGGRIRLSTSPGGRGIGVIQKMPKAGGPVTTLACGLDVGNRFIQDTNYIYWFTSGATGYWLFATEKRTGISTNLSIPNADSLLSLGDGLGVNFTTVYVGGEHGLGIVPRGGGSALQILPGALVPSVAIDNEHVFWTSAISGVSDKLMRANLDGTEITELPTSSGYLLVDDTYVYWMGGNATQAYGPYRMRKDCNGTPRPDLSPTPISAPPRSFTIPACPWNRIRFPPPGQQAI